MNPLCMTLGNVKRRRWVALCLLLTIMASTIACDGGSNLPPTPTQAFSPLPPAIASLLIGPRWEVTEITVNNELIHFDALQPIEIWFDQAGTLNHHALLCSGGAFLIFFESKQRYKIGRGEVAPVDCGEAENRQYGLIQEALAATTAYEIQGNQLFLMGDNVRIVLEIGNAP